MNCDGCEYNPRDWRLCLHPDQSLPHFWKNVDDYSCKKLPACVESPIQAVAEQSAQAQCGILSPNVEASNSGHDK